MNATQRLAENVADAALRLNRADAELQRRMDEYDGYSPDYPYAEALEVFVRHCIVAPPPSPNP